jgi:hypothetical protein
VQQNLAVRYEQLRRDAMSRTAHYGGGLGLALFLRRGMTAWMQAWSECADAETETCSISGGKEVIPADMRSQLATLLAGMILSLRQEATQ